ncbi:hypothetical protein BHE74_00059663 [Ensete ventricosum]|nr:hypothetical protein BHE74_00059663 [Ensete ventricosum]RZS09662.1 hypothetical protein BHM03_00040753 [Ensete ventricosum]
MLLFSFVTYYTSTLLADCYRFGDPIAGKRNYNYTDAVHAYLGEFAQLSLQNTSPWAKPFLPSPQVG